MADLGNFVHPLLNQEPIARDRSDWVVLKVLDGIRSGQFKAGQRLFEEELAETFGVSRAPVRDALHKLETFSIVERRNPRKRIQVRQWTDADRRDVLKILDSLIELSVELAVGKLTEEDFAALDAILDQTRADQETGIDDVRQMERDARIHLIIAQRSHNRWLVDMMQNLMLPLQLFTRESHEYLQSKAWLRMHGNLVDALRRNNPAKALACVRANAEESRSMLVGEPHSEAGAATTAAQNNASAPEKR